MFASNALSWWATAIRADGVVRWPCNAAETAPVDDRDVAAVVARTLYQDGHAGGDYVLTGPESLSQAEQVSIIGDLLGRRITFEELSPDEFRSETERSWPRPAVDMLLAAGGATIGRPAFITSTVFDILGSAPRSFRQWVPITPPRLWKIQPLSYGDLPRGPNALLRRTVADGDRAAGRPLPPLQGGGRCSKPAAPTNRPRGAFA